MRNVFDTGRETKQPPNKLLKTNAILTHPKMLRGIQAAVFLVTLFLGHALVQSVSSFGNLFTDKPEFVV